MNLWNVVKKAKKDRAIILTSECLSGPLQYNTVQYITVQYSTVLCAIVCQCSLTLYCCTGQDEHALQ